MAIFTTAVDPKNKIISVSNNSGGSAVLNLAGKIISITDDNGDSASLDLALKKIQISSADGGIELSLADFHITVYKSDGTTISAALADLVAASTAQFQDVTYVSDVSWDAGTLTLKQTKKTVRVLCVEPDAGTDSDILTGAKYPQTGTCE